MPLSVKHTLQTALADDPAFDVSSSEWNADHSMTGALPIANGGTDATDAATARTNLGAVSKTGDTMSAALWFPNGSESIPSIAFSSGTTDGFYRFTNAVGVTVNGASKFTFGSTVHQSVVPVLLPSAPTLDLHAATKKYVDDVIAGDIAFSATGTIAATTVQTAIAELDTEKVAKAGDTMTGALTMTANVAASDIGFGTLKITGGASISGAAYSTLSLVKHPTNSTFKLMRADNVPGYTLGRSIAGSNLQDFYLRDEVGAQNIFTAGSDGLMLVKGDPTAALGVATKQYADLKVAKTGDTMSGALAITDATASTSTTTGALKVSGGIGVAGAAWFGCGSTNGVSFGSWIGGSTYTSLTLNGSHAGAGCLGLVGGGGAGDAGLYYMAPTAAGHHQWRINNVTYAAISATTVNFYQTTVSTAYNNGALVVGGGVGIAGAVFAGGILSSAVKGSVLGSASGTGMPVAPAATDANLLMYNYSSANWCGQGTDANGNFWLKVGTSGSPLPAFWVSANTQSVTFTKASGYDETALTYMAGGTTTWDVLPAPVATVAMSGGNTTMSNPSSVVAGRVYTIRFVQDTTPRTVAWSVLYKWAGGSSNVPIISAGSGAVDRFTFIGRAGGVLEEVGRSQAIS